MVSLCCWWRCEQSFRVDSLVWATQSGSHHWILNQQRATNSEPQVEMSGATLAQAQYRAPEGLFVFRRNLFCQSGWLLEFLTSRTSARMVWPAHVRLPTWGRLPVRLWKLELATSSSFFNRTKLLARDTNTVMVAHYSRAQLSNIKTICSSSSSSSCI